MLLHGTDALKEAAAAGHALPGFVAYNLETVQGVTAAAEAAGGPVVIQAGSSPFKHAGREALMRLALDAAACSTACASTSRPFGPPRDPNLPSTLYPPPSRVLSRCPLSLWSHRPNPAHLTHPHATTRSSPHRPCRSFIPGLVSRSPAR